LLFRRQFVLFIHINLISVCIITELTFPMVEICRYLKPLSDRHIDARRPQSTVLSARC
jgi:hypothetical protein